MTHSKTPWEIDWYICEDDDGKELWRVPTKIGPIGVDHNHWAGNHISCEPEEAQHIVKCVNLHDEMVEALEQALGYFVEAGKYGDSYTAELIEKALKRAK